MDSKPLWMVAGIACAFLTALPGAQAGNCNNYGIAVNTYVFSPQDCSSHNYVQYCEQGTGAGAGAGAGTGSGTSDSGAAATAGTKCTQDNGGNHTSGGSNKPVGGPVLGNLFWGDAGTGPGLEASLDDDLATEGSASDLLAVTAVEPTPIDGASATEAPPSRA